MRQRGVGRAQRKQKADAGRDSWRASGGAAGLGQRLSGCLGGRGGSERAATVSGGLRVLRARAQAGGHRREFVAQVCSWAAAHD